MHPSLLLLPSLLALALPAPLQDDDPIDPAQRERVQAYWDQVAEMLTTHRSVAQVFPADPVEARLREQLRALQVPQFLLVEQESLRDIGAMLAAMTGLPIVVDDRAENEVYDQGLVFDLAWTQPASVETVLDVVADLAGEEVAWTVHEGTLLFTLRQRTRQPVTHLHHIGDLVGLFDVDDLSTMVQENVNPEAWEEDGVWIEPVGPFLLIGHDREVQLEAEAFLAQLRAFRTTMSERPSFEPRPATGTRDGTLQQLERVRLAPRFEEAPLGEIAAFLQELSGVNFLVSNEVRWELDPEYLSFSLNLDERSVRSLLDLMTELSEELDWSVVDGVVHLHTRQERRKDTLFELYDVRDIVLPGDQRFSLRPDFEDGDEVYEAQVMEAAVLEDMLRNTIDPQSWDMDPSNSLRITQNGVLMVHQSPTVQARVRAQLKQLQAVADVMLEVQRQRRGR